MNDLDFTFERNPWEILLESKREGDAVSAAKLLAMLEGEDEQTVSEILEDISSRGLLLSIADLPKALLNGEAAKRLQREERLVRNGLKLPDLEDSDPLRIYLEELAATPAAGDENLLAQDAARGDERAMNALAGLGLSRVIELAQEYTGYGVLLLDLIQEGSLGLWQSIQSCRADGFFSYRDLWIRNAIAGAIFMHYRSSGVGQKMRSALEDYRTVDEQLLSELGRNATMEEIAQRLHMTPEETSLVKKMLDDARTLQNARASVPAEEQAAEEEQAVEDTAYFQTRQRILELLSVLSEQDARILTLRFGLEKGLPLSPQETAARLGITAEEVVSREAAALARLRSEN